MTDSGFYVGIDLGAGWGAKTRLFERHDRPVAESVLLRERYGNSLDTISEGLAETVQALLEGQKKSLKDLIAVGLSTPGLLASDGSYVLAANLTFLNGKNLSAALEAKLGVPVPIENDANAGGLAEWSAARQEILYWVLGGGWGGAWVGAEGDVRFPSLDWDGDDASLHLTNEPGYATPLPKATFRKLLEDAGGDADYFLELLQKDMGLDGPAAGPSGDPDTLRAEHVLSGPGRRRLFMALTRNDRYYERLLNGEDKERPYKPAAPGRIISDLSEKGDPAAVATDRVFGLLLAEAAQAILASAVRDGCRPDAPVYLGGKPAKALPHFGPPCRQALAEKGLANELRPSVIYARGENANLLGAVVLAEKSCGNESLRG